MAIEKGLNLKQLGGMVKKAGKSVADTAKGTVDKTKNISKESYDKIVKVVDTNGNGEIDIEDIIILGLKVPGVAVERDKFFQKEFFKRYSQEIIDIAISESPAKANIPIEDINIIAEEVIKYERNCVSGISAALGIPGGGAMVATIPADIAQYYGYMIRVIQKLLYLYGFPQIDVEAKEQKFDSETLNMITLCLGAMYGVAGANTAIKSMAKALAVGVEKQLIKKALTKGTIYPIVKSVSKWFGVNMTKQIFAGFFKKAIPVLGGVIGGTITFVTFKPCCDKLKEILQDTVLTNPDYVQLEDEIIIDIIETEDIEVFS